MTTKRKRAMKILNELRTMARNTAGLVPMVEIHAKALLRMVDDLEASLPPEMPLRLPQRTRTAVLNAYKAGTPVVEIRREFGVSGTYIAALVKEAGISRKPRKAA